MSANNQGQQTHVGSPVSYEELCRRLEEAEQTIEAIRRGDIDGLVVVAGPRGEQVYSLAGAEHVYRVIVETMHEAALTVDPDGTILFCNRCFCDLMKSPIREVLGHKLTAFVAPPQRTPLQRLLAEAWTGPVQRRLTLRATDGTAVPVQLSASPLAAGTSPSLCLVASDLTELEASAKSVRVLREHQLALEESEERLRVAQELSPDGFSILRPVRDAQGRIVDFVWVYENGAIARLNGTDPNAVVGRRLLELFPAQRDTPFFQAYEQVARTGDRSLFEAEFRDPRLPQPIWLRIAVVPTGGDIAVLAEDITARRRTEEALRELNATLESRVAERTAELERRAKQLQKLTLELSRAGERERRRIAVLLHEDLLQQIAGAKFHLNLLNGPAQRASQQEVVQRIDEMLKEVIEKSRRLSHDLSPAVLHMNDLGEILRWLANQVRKQQGLTVHIEAIPEMTLQSESLTIFLFRAVQELLLNAVRHGCVTEATIRVRRRGRHVRLWVSDRGRGFDPQGLQDTVGCGLLSIRERVELLGGRMRIRSGNGSGTTVRIVVSDDPSEDGKAQISNPPSPANSKS